MKTLFSIPLSLIIICSVKGQELFPFREGNKWFYVDTSSRPVFKKTYSFLYPFKGKYAVVAEDNKYGIINKKGEAIIKCVYDTVFYDGRLPFYCIKNGKAFHIGEDGKEEINLLGYCGGSRGYMSHFNEYKRNNLIGMLIWNVKLNKYDSLPAIYDKLIENYRGIAFVKKENKWGILDRFGNLVADFIFDDVRVNGCADNSSYCYSIFSIAEKKGFISDIGKIIVPAKYVDAKFFDGRYALVETNDKKWGYINESGKEFFK
ncbi:MAG TPA: WG repeat-containing protein [Bacteroidia bacterium]|nr:WG repeat-containing protein [Bacteroidia bacterium]